MEIMPSEYQQLELTRSEKIFIRHAISSEKYGFLLLKANPAMQKNDDMHILLCEDGIVMFKFFETFDDTSKFTATMSMYATMVHKTNAKIITDKLLSNKALVDSNGKLKVAINIVYVFPKLNRSDVIRCCVSEEMRKFVNECCLFAEEFAKLRTDFFEIVVGKFLQHTITSVSDERMIISDSNINSILQRIAPEYVTIRVSVVANKETKTGADNELLVVTENDIAVKAFRLDREQINIVNKINKGDQLILACAGSGKSVLLIAKCFKAAAMNPDKQFLITCYNDNLHSLYTWFIDRAGLRAKNVTCMTFHKLCKHLLSKNGFPTPYGEFDGWVNSAIDKLNQGKILERFYGIFIDEVQEFNPEWYKFCFNLLENKDSDDHLFVICGDKTQKLKNQQKHGRAPWNAGEGYPNYRGGNKNIRIEKNYRNCIEINEYINRFVSRAKAYLYAIQKDYELDPDMFLRGQAVNEGIGVQIKRLTDQRNKEEARVVVESIRQMHDVHKIPYDEIAIIMYNGKYGSIDGWKDRYYRLEKTLEDVLLQEDIPSCKMYSTDTSWAAHYGSDGGVRLIKFASVLGLDFRGAIVCGLKPLGCRHKTKKPNWELLRGTPDEFDQAIEMTHSDIRNLYVACTRAKEVLHIVLPEDKSNSEYVRILEESL